MAEIFGKKISTQLYLQTIDNTLNMVVGAGKSIVVTSIGYDDVVLLNGGYVGGLIDSRFQITQVRAELGADG